MSVEFLTCDARRSMQLLVWRLLERNINEAAYDALCKPAYENTIEPLVYLAVDLATQDVGL